MNVAKVVKADVRLAAWWRSRGTKWNRKEATPLLTRLDPRYANDSGKEKMHCPKFGVKMEDALERWSVQVVIHEVGSRGV